MFQFLRAGLRPRAGLKSHRYVKITILALSFLGGLALLAAAGGEALAQDETAGDGIDSGHTAWMLVSTALVLLMTPGLALFYGGMVRSKNILGTIMHSMFAMGIITMVWVVVGYSIAFGGDVGGGWFGNPLDHIMLKGVPWDSGDGYPKIIDAAFQLMFAIITPALITGAFAERVKFRSYVLFIVLWSVIVYSPLTHWVWGGGILAHSDLKGQATAAAAEKNITLPAELLAQLEDPAQASAAIELLSQNHEITVEPTLLESICGVGAIDFAGGTVVHISSGISALIFVLLIGRRRGYPRTAMPPGNLVLTMLGAGILWFGWFGFNGGSALASDGIAALAFVNTHICAAVGAVAWAVAERLHHGKASALGFASGLVAGLVCITPAAGFVEPGSAFIMGLIVSPVCYLFVAVLKAKLNYDDSLDAFGIHGVGGTVGAVLTGVFCTAQLNGVTGMGGGGRQVMAQIIATVVTYVFAGVVTAVLVVVIDKTIGMRVSEDDESTGLDLTQHGEVGYNL